MKPKRSQSRPLTTTDLRKELGSFTDSVILPGVQAIVDERIGDVTKVLREEMADLRAEIRSGMSEMATAFKVFAHEVVARDERQEVRLEKIETRLGMRGKGH